jgi:hypothetical protein
MRSSAFLALQLSENRGIALSELQRSLKIVRRASEPQLMAVQIEAAERNDRALELMARCADVNLKEISLYGANKSRVHSDQVALGQRWISTTLLHALSYHLNDVVNFASVCGECSVTPAESEHR